MAEGCAMLFQSIATYILLVYDFGLLAYALSQLVYSITLFPVYIFSIRVPLRGGNAPSDEQKALVGEYSWSCGLKFVLTQGEKIFLIG